jgi:hypothetical protein
MNRHITLLALLAVASPALAQETKPAETPPAEPPVDTAALKGKVEAVESAVAELKSEIDKAKKLKFSGYLQARYAFKDVGLPDSAPPSAYNTSPGSAISQNGFFIRRGRLKTVYDASTSQYVVQIDIVPSGVSIKEGYASIKLPKGWAIDAGLQLFPFGYEVYSRSSSDLDTLERSAVTRAFLAGEYDLGVALRGKAGPVNLKLGVFNGNGIDAGTSGLDNDQLKDVIGRATIDLGMVTAGVSGWYGKTIDWSRADDKKFDRYRAAADVQVYLDLLPIGGTAVKGEYVWGRTTIGSGAGGAGGNLPANTSDAPVPTGSGWYGIVTQNVGSWNQVAVRYEQFRRNHTLVGGATESTSNVKVNEELQVAVHTFLGDSLKITAAWFHPMFGKAVGPAPGDPKADQYIAQVQAKF